MLRRAALAIAATGAIAAAPVHAATSSIFGLWATPRNNGRVEILPCGDMVCARILDGNQIRANPDQTDALNPDPAKRNRRVKGLTILEGYRGGPTVWRDGSVYDPQTGDFSSDSTLALVAPGSLKVEGCRLVFCRSEMWTRLSDAVEQ